MIDLNLRSRPSQLQVCLTTPPHELGVDRENTRGNLHFLSAFRARKVPLLGGLEAHLLCLGRGVAPAAADLAGAGLTLGPLTLSLRPASLDLDP